MSRLGAYERYRETGIWWIGKVPSHWQCAKTKRFAELRSGHTPSRSKPEYWVDCTIPWFSLADVWQLRDQRNIFLGDTKEKISELGLANSAADLLPAGTVVLSRTASVGFSGIMPRPMATTQDFVNWVPGPELSSKYLLYVLRSMGPVFESLKTGSTHKTIYVPDVLSFSTPLPPHEEQAQIARFLDYETAKIDALIDKQRQLIALLNEKRQAVVSHAVTKGLNPDAPLRDSGIEWLGKVPAHWLIRKLKHTIESGTSISYGIVQPGDPVDQGVPFIQTTNMSRGTFNIEDLQRTTVAIANAYPRSRLLGGEVVLGIRASIGAAYEVPQHLRGCNLSRGVARIAPAADVLTRYLVWFLRSDAVMHYWGLSSQGSTFSEVSIETVRNLHVALPPASEQLDVVRHLDEKTAHIDRLMQSADRKTDLLQERRAALISAAVTGKIDVRNWKAPELDPEAAAAAEAEVA